jgi:DNA-binding CsgD family transcriptional regulator
VGRPDPTPEELAGQQRDAVAIAAEDWRALADELRAAAASWEAVPGGGPLLLRVFIQERAEQHRFVCERYGFDPARGLPLLHACFEHAPGTPGFAEELGREGLAVLYYALLDRIVEAGLRAAQSLTGQLALGPGRDRDRRMVRAMFSACYEQLPYLCSAFTAYHIPEGPSEARRAAAAQQLAGLVRTQIRRAENPRLDAALMADGRDWETALLDELPGAVLAVLPDVNAEHSLVARATANIADNEPEAGHHWRLASERARKRLGPVADPLERAQALKDTAARELARLQASLGEQAAERTDPAVATTARESDRVEAEVALAEEARRLAREARLSRQQGEVLLLSLQHPRLDDAQIAVQLKTTVGTVRVQRSRAKDKLDRLPSPEELRRRLAE